MFWLWDYVSIRCYEVINGIIINLDIFLLKKLGWNIIDWLLWFFSWWICIAVYLLKGNF